MTITQQVRNQEFRNGVLIHEDVINVDVTADVVTLDLHQKARDALVVNAAALAQLPAAQTAIQTVLANSQLVIDGTPNTIPQCNTAIDALAAEVKRAATVIDGLLTSSARALRVDDQLIRLVIGADLLTDDTTIGPGTSTFARVGQARVGAVASVTKAIRTRPVIVAAGSAAAIAAVKALEIAVHVIR